MVHLLSYQALRSIDMWCNNGKEEKIYVDVIPDGFVKGRLHKPGKRELEIERLYLELDREEFIDFYSNNTVSETMYHFNIYDKRVVFALCKKFDFVKEKPTYTGNTRSHESYIESAKKSAETQRKNWQLKSDEEMVAWRQLQIDTHNTEEYKKKQSEIIKESFKKISPELHEKRNEMRRRACKAWWASLTPERKQEEVNKHFNGGAGYHTANSKPNLNFKSLLEQNDIEFSREFRLENFSYDFKVGNNLIEINPTATHNSTWSPFGTPLERDYHLEKRECAVRNNFNLICIWDWDNLDKVISLLISKKKIFARKCCIKELENVDGFLNSYHLQGSCKGQSIKLGLFYGDELVEVMTFGKPRYNKNYEYELLRLCTKSDVEVVGGSSKLFNYFIKNYKPINVISYCDDSKFRGDIYSKLGFVKGRKAKPSSHWYNPLLDMHITDNLLRKYGFDKLVGNKIGESFGKNTNNEELMIEHGFVELYDCGQSSYIYKNK